MSGTPRNGPSDDPRGYPRALLEHYQSPRHRGPLAHATHSSSVDNPLCGDRITMAVRMEGDARIAAAGFDGIGCAISLGAADIIAAAAMGVDAPTVAAWDEAWLHHQIGMVPAPGRRRCASLPLEALQRALLGNLPPQEK